MSDRLVDILLVEDNDDDVFMVKRAFKTGNLVNELKVVNDGEQALAYLRGEDPYGDVPAPGLILLDINMPKKDGFEVLEEIKQDKSIRHIPVVMLTTSSREEDVVRSFSNGACSYITKPVEFKEFVEVVQQFKLYWGVVSKIP